MLAGGIDVSSYYGRDFIHKYVCRNINLSSQARFCCSHRLYGTPSTMYDDSTSDLMSALPLWPWLESSCYAVPESIGT